MTTTGCTNTTVEYAQHNTAQHLHSTRAFTFSSCARAVGSLVGSGRDRHSSLAIVCRRTRYRVCGTKRERSVVVSRYQPVFSPSLPFYYSIFSCECLCDDSILVLYCTVLYCHYRVLTTSGRENEWIRAFSFFIYLPSYTFSPRWREQLAVVIEHTLLSLR